MALIVSVNPLQFIAMYGLMTVRWTGELTQTSSGLQFFILDINALSLTCLASSSPAQYVLASMAFPAVAAWLMVAHVLMHVVPRVPVWKLPNTLNTVGAMLQMGFSAMSATALQPFMCYEHPNGLRSMVPWLARNFLADSTPGPRMISFETRQFKVLLRPNTLALFVAALSTHPWPSLGLFSSSSQLHTLPAV